MMDWWKRRSTGAQYAIVIVVLLVVVGAASGGGEKESQDSEDAAATSTVNSVTTESDTAAAETTPAPKPDSGRMSEGEFRDFTSEAGRFEEEARVYVDLISSECAFILSGGQTKEFLDCEEDAFDGVIGAYSLADEAWEERDADVAKTCRVRLEAAVEGLNNYADVLTGTHNLAKRGQIDSKIVGEAAGTLIAKRRDSFRKRVTTVARDCAPT